jgi:heavy metal efflux system protein
LSYPPVQTVFSEQGRGDEGTDPDGSFLAEFFVPLKPTDEWPAALTKEQMVKQMSERLNREFVGVDFNFSQYIQDNIEEAISGVKGKELVDAAVQHAVAVHGHHDSPQLRQELTKMIKTQ